MIRVSFHPCVLKENPGPVPPSEFGAKFRGTPKFEEWEKIGRLWSPRFSIQVQHGAEHCEAVVTVKKEGSCTRTDTVVLEMFQVGKYTARAAEVVVNAMEELYFLDHEEYCALPAGATKVTLESDGEGAAGGCAAMDEEMVSLDQPVDVAMGERKKKRKAKSARSAPKTKK